MKYQTRHPQLNQFLESVDKLVETKVIQQDYVFLDGEISVFKSPTGIGLAFSDERLCRLMMKTLAQILRGQVEIVPKDVD